MQTFIRKFSLILTFTCQQKGYLMYFSKLCLLFYLDGLILFNYPFVNSVSIFKQVNKDITSIENLP